MADSGADVIVTAFLIAGAAAFLVASAAEATRLVRTVQAGVRTKGGGATLAALLFCAAMLTVAAVLSIVGGR